tara:strand:- start:1966 stop:2331 length:366 start_codon:yes stop_codon:yes gene_type:complete
MSDEVKELAESLNQQKLDIVGFEFRVDNLEKQLGSTLGMLEKLDGKMDNILDKLSVQSEQNALAAQKLDVVSRDHHALLRRVEVCERKLVDVQVSVAKKIAYGAGGGAMVTGLVQLIKMMG